MKHSILDEISRQLPLYVEVGANTAVAFEIRLKLLSSNVALLLKLLSKLLLVLISLLLAVVLMLLTLKLLLLKLMSSLSVSVADAIKLQTDADIVEEVHVETAVEGDVVDVDFVVAQCCC